MNVPDRYELFALQPNQQKVEYQKDTKSQNTGSFIIQKEDHTLGNVLTMQLFQNSNVLFAGYKMPHPLEHYVAIKIQTNSQTKPEVAMYNALDNLIEQCCILEKKFNEQLEKLKKPSNIDSESYY
jgi:DNA-directed RNA polymerase II subunit RPB11